MKCRSVLEIFCAKFHINYTSDGLFNSSGHYFVSSGEDLVTEVEYNSTYTGEKNIHNDITHYNFERKWSVNHEKSFERGY